MHRYITLVFFSFCLASSSAQNIPPVKQPDGGGSYRDLVNIKDDISPKQRAAIIQMLQKNEATLKKTGYLERTANPTATAFQWPLKQAPGYNDNGYYGISNYVDENPLYPNAILDYNCGNRSYDLSSGYNHAGTDIFLWPFYWKKMEWNAIQIIAAAPGTIIGKSDGNFDQNCAFCSGACNWNAVYVQHADGSVAWYGHMKSGSLTTKTVGQTVALGEYLGSVGSSGNSTGPHLHFEVYTNSSYTQLVDPWAGPCNSLNGNTSWWASQQSYYVPTLNKIMTHGAAPQSGNCPADEIMNEKINFVSGDIIYLGSYYRDQQNGQQSIHTIYRPDGTIFTSWSQNFTTYYAASWWWYSVTLPTPAPAGVWRYEILYNGSQKQFALFTVSSAPVNICPGNYNTLTCNTTGSTYQWQANTGSGFSNITDGTYYGNTATRLLQLKNIPSSFYGNQYRCLVNSLIYSDVITVKFVSYWKGYVSKAWEDPANWSCGNIPDANTDVVIESATNIPEVNSMATCRSTTMASGTSIKVKAGMKLDITH